MKRRRIAESVYRKRRRQQIAKEKMIERKRIQKEMKKIAPDLADRADQLRREHEERKKEELPF